MELRLAPDARLNQDREGNSRSVVLRLYQLNAAEAFTNASYEELASGLENSAGASAVVVGPEVLTVIPNKIESRTLKRSPKSTHLAVLANFREHGANSGWKATFDLPPSKDPCGPDSAPIAASLELVDFTIRFR